MCTSRRLAQRLRMAKVRGLFRLLFGAVFGEAFLLGTKHPDRPAICPFNDHLTAPYHLVNTPITVDATRLL